MKKTLILALMIVTGVAHAESKWFPTGDSNVFSSNNVGTWTDSQSHKIVKFEGWLFYKKENQYRTYTIYCGVDGYYEESIDRKLVLNGYINPVHKYWNLKNDWCN